MTSLPEPDRLEFFQPLTSAASAVLSEVVACRGVLWSLWRNEIRVRYAASAAGLIWALIGPLSLVAIYSIVFGSLLRARIPALDRPGGYGSFVLSGTMPWLLVSHVMNQAPGNLLSQGPTLRRFAIPPAHIPATTVLTGLTDMLVASSLFLIYMAFLRQIDLVKLMVLFPAVALLCMMVFGLALGLSALNLYGRDVSHAIGAFLPFWFFWSPIAYAVPLLSPVLQVFVTLNPLTAFVRLFNWTFSIAPAPSLVEMVYSVSFALGAFLLGSFIHQETRKDFMDLL